MENSWSWHFHGGWLSQVSYWELSGGKSIDHPLRNYENQKRKIGKPLVCKKSGKHANYHILIHHSFIFRIFWFEISISLFCLRNILLFSSICQESFPKLSQKKYSNLVYPFLLAPERNNAEILSALTLSPSLIWTNVSIITLKQFNSCYTTAEYGNS